MKELATMTVSSVGQSTLPKWWREVSDVSKGGVIVVRPLRDGRQSIVLTPEVAPAGQQHEQLFALNTIGPLAITCIAGVIDLKLPLTSLPTQYVLVEGAAPCSAGIRYARHYPFLGFLPEPIDGWSHITALYVARYGVPREGQAIFIRTRQHIDGWTDNPILTRAVVRAA